MYITSLLEKLVDLYENGQLDLQQESPAKRLLFRDGTVKNEAPYVIINRVQLTDCISCAYLLVISVNCARTCKYTSYQNERK